MPHRALVPPQRPPPIGSFWPSAPVRAAARAGPRPPAQTEPLRRKASPVPSRGSQQVRARPRCERHRAHAATRPRQRQAPSPGPCPPQQAWPAARQSGHLVQLHRFEQHCAPPTRQAWLRHPCAPAAHASCRFRAGARRSPFERRHGPQPPRAGLHSRALRQRPRAWHAIRQARHHAWQPLVPVAEPQRSSARQVERCAEPLPPAGQTPNANAQAPAPARPRVEQPLRCIDLKYFAAMRALDLVHSSSLLDAHFNCLHSTAARGQKRRRRHNGNGARTTTKVPVPFVVVLAPYSPKKLRIWSRLTGLYSLASRPTS